MLLITGWTVDKSQRGKWLRQSRVANQSGGLRPDQCLCWQHRLHHEAAGASVHHADGAQRQQRDGLHGVAQPGGIVQILGRQRTDERFMQCAEQRCSGERCILRRQVTSANGAGVGLVSWYWHFVDGVWVVVFSVVYLVGR